MKRKAIFLDKDGTLIPDIPYNVDPALILISDQAVDGLRLLSREDYMLVVVSNQSGVAKGFFSEEQLPPVFDKINTLLSKEGLKIDAFYYCPHDPAIDTCECRKPLPGMLFKAAEEWNIDLSLSWMIGDILNDVEAGKSAGCKTVLIDNGNETEWLMSERRTPDFKARNINDAARYIVGSSNHQYNEKELAGL